MYAWYNIGGKVIPVLKRQTGGAVPVAPLASTPGVQTGIPTGGTAQPAIQSYLQGSSPSTSYNSSYNPSYSGDFFSGLKSTPIDQGSVEADQQAQQPVEQPVVPPQPSETPVDPRVQWLDSGNSLATLDKASIVSGTSGNKDSSRAFAEEHGIELAHDDGEQEVQQKINNAVAANKAAQNVDKYKTAANSKDASYLAVRELGLGNYSRDDAPDILRAHLAKVEAGQAARAVPASAPGAPPQAITETSRLEELRAANAESLENITEGGGSQAAPPKVSAQEAHDTRAKAAQDAHANAVKTAQDAHAIHRTMAQEAEDQYRGKETGVGVFKQTAADKMAAHNAKVAATNYAQQVQHAEATGAAPPPPPESVKSQPIVSAPNVKYNDVKQLPLPHWEIDSGLAAGHKPTLINGKTYLVDDKGVASPVNKLVLKQKGVDLASLTSGAKFNNGGPVMGYNRGGSIEERLSAAEQIARSRATAAPLAPQKPLAPGQIQQNRDPLGELAGGIGKKLVGGALTSALGPLGGLLGGLLNDGGPVPAYNKGGKVSIWDKIWGEKTGKKGSLWEQFGRNDGGPIPGGPLSGNPHGYNEGGPGVGATPIKRVQDEQKIELDKMTWKKMESRKDQQMQMDEKRKQEAFQMEQQRKAEAHKEAMKMKKAAATTNKGPLGG